MEVSEAQKSAILRSNGWQTLWSDNNWIRTAWLSSPTVDWSGMTLEDAFQSCMMEIQRDRAQASFDSANQGHPAYSGRRLLKE